MHGSSVLIVHPPADRFRLPDMAHGKPRHYSLDSPSLTSPPGYVDPLMDQKPPIGLSMSMHMPTTSAMPIASSPQFSSFNPHLVMAPTGPPGLLHISKFRESRCRFVCSCVVFSAFVFDEVAVQNCRLCRRVALLVYESLLAL